MTFSHAVIEFASIEKYVNKEIEFMEKNNIKLNKYKTLMKLYDQADVINDIV